MKSSNRRKFIKTSSTAALSLPLAARAVGANEKITVGIIGPGGMGSAHLSTLSHNKAVNIAYVCDVDERRTARARTTVEKTKGKAPPRKIQEFPRGAKYPGSFFGVPPL